MARAEGTQARDTADNGPRAPQRWGTIALQVCDKKQPPVKLPCKKWERNRMDYLEELQPAEPEEFVVEEVLHQSVLDGQVEYFLKWTGFTDADSTWGPEENLHSPELIETFPNSQKAGEEKDGTKRESLFGNESDDSKSKKKRDAADEPRGFARGLDPE